MKPLIALLLCLSLCSVTEAARDKSVRVERHNGRIVKREARVERRAKKVKTPKAAEKPLTPTPDVPPPAPGA